jgi:hypothetical protein
MKGTTLFEAISIGSIVSFVKYCNDFTQIKIPQSVIDDYISFVDALIADNYFHAFDCNCDKCRASR